MTARRMGKPGWRVRRRRAGQHEHAERFGGGAPNLYGRWFPIQQTLVKSAVIQTRYGGIRNDRMPPFAGQAGAAGISTSLLVIRHEKGAPVSGRSGDRQPERGAGGAAAAAGGHHLDDWKVGMGKACHDFGQQRAGGRAGNAGRLCSYRVRPLGRRAPHAGARYSLAQNAFSPVMTKGVRNKIRMSSHIDQFSM